MREVVFSAAKTNGLRSWPLTEMLEAGASEPCARARFCRERAVPGERRLYPADSRHRESWSRVNLTGGEDDCFRSTAAESGGLLVAVPGARSSALFERSRSVA